MPHPVRAQLGRGPFLEGTALNLSMNSPGIRQAGPRQRTFGVEEEFLLVDPATGQPAPLAEPALRRTAKPPRPRWGSILTPEVQQEQLEAVSPVCSTLRELTAAIREGRALADEAARSVGARAVALATSPLAAIPTLVPQPRYLMMAARFGLTLKEQLTCGFHIHVHVVSGEEGVAVLDRIRVWLPVLLALSANSPFWQGNDRVTPASATRRGTAGRRRVPANGSDQNASTAVTCSRCWRPGYSWTRA